MLMRLSFEITSSSVILLSFLIHVLVLANTLVQKRMNNIIYSQIKTKEAMQRTWNKESLTDRMPIQ